MFYYIYFMQYKYTIIQYIAANNGDHSGSMVQKVCREAHHEISGRHIRQMRLKKQASRIYVF